MVSQKILLFLHQLLFRSQPSEEMVRFLKNVRTSIFSGLLAYFFLFVIYILAGRWLGPVEYGRASIVMATAQIIGILAAGGFDVSAGHLIPAHHGNEILIGYLIRSFFIIVGVSGLFLLAIKSYLFPVLRFPDSLIGITIIFSIMLATKNFTDGLMRGFQSFRLQAILRFVEATIVALIFFVLMLIIQIQTAEGFLWAFIGGFVVFSLMVFWRTIKRRVGPALGENLKAKVVTYSLTAMAWNFSLALLISGNRLVLNHLLGSAEVGLYTAYMIAALTIISQVMIFFLNVFFPAASSAIKPSPILEKLNIMRFIIAIPLFLIEVIMIIAVMKIYGQSFPLDWRYILVFAGLATVYVTVNIDMWFASSLGIRGLRMVTLITLCAAIINLILSWYTITKMQSSLGAGVALLVVLLLLMVVIPRFNRFLIQRSLHTGVI